MQVIELKLFNLIGLLSGEMGRWVGNPPFKSLIDLDKKLQTESEEELLNRNYFYWSKEELKYKSIKVKKYIDNGKIQLNNYINILKKGDVSQNEVGVFDERINVGMGYSYMMGYLIVSLGTQRIIVKKTKYKKIDYYFSLKK